ncbi:Permease of the drug/metabolite transporter (DMT) superfamily [Candidatus Burkholderia brachyanthoides]|nr:Permease of the drug/metabolite transporter (DMT) superfamily [Candidatus Burkholderia brachyanthoides]
MFSGALLQGVYLGAGYWAVAQGMAAGIMALLGALQPLLTAAVAARLFGERLSARAWGGLVLGLAGVALVLAPKIASQTAPAAHASVLPWLVVSVGVLAIVAITAGTLYQKTSLVAADIRTASALQNAGVALVAMMLAFPLGEHRFVASTTTWSALAWGIVMLSSVATTLLGWSGAAMHRRATAFLAPISRAAARRAGELSRFRRKAQCAATDGLRCGARRRAAGAAQVATAGSRVSRYRVWIATSHAHADMPALILFFTTTGVINERFIAGMIWDQVLHARLLGAALMAVPTACGATS